MVLSPQTLFFLTGPRCKNPLATKSLSMTVPQSEGAPGQNVLVKLRLDLMGRVYDEESGQYLKASPCPGFPPTARFVLGTRKKGVFVTLDEDNDFVPWKTPSGWWLQ